MLGTQSLGLGWQMSEVGTGLEQKSTCFSPHNLIIWACHPGPETESTTTTTTLLLILGEWRSNLINMLFSSSCFLSLF